VLWIWFVHAAAHVAEEAGITIGTLTSVITTLLKRSLIGRLLHKHDRRRVSIELSPAGEHLIEGLWPAFNQHEREAVSAHHRRAAGVGPTSA
jgi:DNA-binding MarR family transcriptional regulator